MAIISTITEAARHIKLGSNYSEGNLPNFDAAIQMHLLPIIGETLYNELSAAYDGDSLTPKQETLLPLCQAVIVPFAFAEDLPLMQLMLGDSGPIALEVEGNRKAYKWEYNNLLDALFVRAYAAQEALILYLKANKADYPSWSASPYNNVAAFPIVRDGSDMSGVISLQQRHRCYMLLQGIFQTVAEVYIKPAVGDEYYDALCANIIAGTTTAEEDAILPNLRMAAIRKALEIASVEMSMRFNGQGFTIAYETKEQADEARQAAKDRQLLDFRTQMADFSRKSLDLVISYMNKYASETVFPEFFASDLYKDPDETSRHPDNSLYTGIFRAT